MIMDGDNATKMRVAYERLANGDHPKLGSPCLTPESGAELVLRGFSTYLQLLMIEQQARTADNLGAVVSTLDQLRASVDMLVNQINEHNDRQARRSVS